MSLPVALALQLLQCNAQLCHYLHLCIPRKNVCCAKKNQKKSQQPEMQENCLSINSKADSLDQIHPVPTSV